MATAEAGPALRVALGEDDVLLREGIARILTEAGLLEREKRGVWAYYRLVPTAIATIADLLTPPRKRATKKAR